MWEFHMDFPVDAHKIKDFDSASMFSDWLRKTDAFHCNGQFFLPLGNN